MGATWSQFFPATPTLTETNLPRQDGKVFIVTGGASGVGFELCSILYHAGGKVYLAGRSGTNAHAAISRIKAQPTTSSRAPGELIFLPIHLDDLATIKPAVEKFLQVETRLDVLFNNAGVSNPPKGSVGAQGHELQMTTNCLGPWLLTQLLVPTLVSTARLTGPNTTRVIWTSSIATEFDSPQGGINLDHLSNTPPGQQLSYATSKTGNWFLADALAKQVGGDGVVSVTQNPGNTKTALTRHISPLVPILAAPLLYKPRMGAYTGIWAAFSPELTVEDGGKYIVPWGRIHPSPRDDILKALRSRDEGGTGVAAIFADWCSRQVADFT